jgi:putative ABC transport system permease protein
MIKQAIALTSMNLQALPQRWGSALVDVFGVACVVGVFVGLFSIVSTYREMLLSNADDSTLLALKTGASSESESGLSKDDADSIATIAKATDAASLVSPETSRFISLKRPNTSGYVTLALRGVTGEAAKIRSKLKIVAGRDLQTGRYELLVGRSAQLQFEGVALGDTLKLADVDWKIVGVFEAGGSAVESEVWAELPMLQSAFRLGNGVHSVRVKPSSNALGAALIERLKANPTLGVTMQRENDYFEGSVGRLFSIVRAFAYPLLVVMVIGALFAGINTMYGAVAARTREIGTARALGFGAAPVAVSVVVESMLLGLAGGALGIALIYLALDGLEANSNFLSERQYAFRFVVSPDVMRQGLLWALAIGVVGGLLPALRAARMTVVRALSES